MKKSDRLLKSNKLAYRNFAFSSKVGFSIASTRQQHLTILFEFSGKWESLTDIVYEYLGKSNDISDKILDKDRYFFSLKRANGVNISNQNFYLRQTLVTCRLSVTEQKTKFETSPTQIGLICPVKWCKLISVRYYDSNYSKVNEIIHCLRKLEVSILLNPARLQVLFYLTSYFVLLFHLWSLNRPKLHIPGLKLYRNSRQAQYKGHFLGTRMKPAVLHPHFE